MAARVSIRPALFVALTACAGFAHATFVDPLDAPAQKSALATTRLLNGAALAGQRVVVVGQRGHILYSDDAGRSWTQAAVPVAVDLTAVSFPTPQKGWAVGHSGVVLASQDGGVTWVKQLDGRAAAATMVEHFERMQSKAASPETQKLLEDAKRFADEGPDKPFLDVFFENEKTGYVVGTFNFIFRTEDGGRSWVPLFDRTDNPKLLHFYAVRGIGEDLYVAGEQGLVLKLDRKADRFRSVATSYTGTLFGLTGTQGAVIAYGLRGTVYRSSDGGAQWTKVETGVPAALTAAATLPDGRIALLSQAGHVLLSSDAGARFSPARVERPLPASAAVALDGGTLVVAGPHGVGAQPLR